MRRTDRLAKLGEWFLLSKVVEKWITIIMTIICGAIALLAFFWVIYQAKKIFGFGW